MQDNELLKLIMREIGLSQGKIVLAIVLITKSVKAQSNFDSVAFDKEIQKCMDELEPDSDLTRNILKSTLTEALSKLD